VLGTSGWRSSARCVSSPAFCLRRNSCLHHSTNFLQRECSARACSAIELLARRCGPGGTRTHNRRNSRLRHAANFLRRERAAQVFSAALSAELRQLSPPAGVEPATVGLVEVSRAFTTPQTLQSFSLPPCFLTSLLPLFGHTRSVSFSRQILGVRNSGRNWRSRLFGNRTRSLSALRTKEP